MTLTKPFQLTQEEAFLWQCACHWRHPDRLEQAGDDLDWSRVAEIVQANKMQTLLYTVLSESGRLEDVPKQIRHELAKGVEKMEGRAKDYSMALADYLEQATAENIPTIVLKGLSIGHNFYQNPAMRPGGDIDLLVRKRHLHPSLEILDKMGNYRWHKLLDDRYYERHHLHQIRGRLDTHIWFEVHWALDHPYTLLTIDYEAMLDRAEPGTLLERPVHDLSPSDQLLSQVVHLVKHAVYLPATVHRSDTPRIVLADAMLMYYLDVAETIGHYGRSLDWTETIRLAREWGAEDMLGAVLRVCKRYLDVDVPQDVLAELPGGKSGKIHGYMMNRLVDYESALHMGLKPSRFWAFMVGYQEALVLRPIRLLDAFSFLSPPTDFLRRRYGRANLLTRLQHAFKATAKYLHNFVDFIYFTWDYHRRLKKEDIAHGFIEPTKD